MIRDPGDAEFLDRKIEGFNTGFQVDLNLEGEMFQRQNFIVALISTSLFVGACGGRGGNSTAAPAPDPLNKTQKDRVLATIDSVNQSAMSVRMANEQSTTPGNIGARNLTTPARSEKTKLMSDALLAAKCQTSVQLPDNDPTKSGKFDFAVSASGQGCPIAMDLRVNALIGPEDQTLSMAFKYNVLTESYRSFNDVTAVDFNATLSSHIKEVSPKTYSIYGEANGGGSIQSQKEGLIQIAISGSLSGSGNEQGATMQGEFVVRIRYPDGLTAELKEVTTQTPQQQEQQSRYFLNGQEITKAEYDQYLGGGALDQIQSHFF